MFKRKGSKETPETPKKEKRAKQTKQPKQPKPPKQKKLSRKQTKILAQQKELQRQQELQNQQNPNSPQGGFDVGFEQQETNSPNKQTQQDDGVLFPLQDEEEVDFGIGLQDVEVDSTEFEPKSKKLFKILIPLTLVVGILIIAISAINNQPEEVPDDLQGEIVNPHPEDEEDEEEPVDPDSIVYGDDVPDDWLDEIDQKEKEEQEGVYFLPDGYMYYENGYINMKLAMSERWYVTERTQEGFDQIKGNAVDGVFYLKDAELTGVLPVADFENSDVENYSTIKVLIYPKEEKELLTNTIISDFIPFTARLTTAKGYEEFENEVTEMYQEEIQLQKEEEEGKETEKTEGELLQERLDGFIDKFIDKLITTEEVEIGDYKAHRLTYWTDDFGELSINTQTSIDIGNAYILFFMSAKETDYYEGSVEVLEEMIKSIYIEEQAEEVDVEGNETETEDVDGETEQESLEEVENE